MADLILTCTCQHEMKVSEFTFGMRGRCPHCHAVLTVSEGNTRPLQSAPPPPVEDDAPEFVAAPEPAASGAGCKRCGRAFRGDWDRYSSPKGTVCHMCANLWEAELRKGGTIRTELEINVRQGLASVAPIEPPRPKPSFSERHRERLRHFALAAGICVIVFVLAAPWFLPNTEPEPTSTVSSGPQPETEQPAFLTGPQPETEQPAFLTAFVIAVAIVAGVAQEFMPLYLILMWAQKLPNDTVPRNVLAVGMVAVGLYVLGFVLGLLPIGMLGGLIGIIAHLYVLWGVYELTWFETFVYLIACSIAKGLVWAVKALILGIAGQIFL